MPGYTATRAFQTCSCVGGPQTPAGAFVRHVPHPDSVWRAFRSALCRLLQAGNARCWLCAAGAVVTIPVRNIPADTTPVLWPAVQRGRWCTKFHWRASSRTSTRSSMGRPRTAALAWGSSAWSCSSAASTTSGRAPSFPATPSASPPDPGAVIMSTAPGTAAYILMIAPVLLVLLV